MTPGTDRVTSCDNVDVIGGYGVVEPDEAFYRNYESLPSHSAIRFSIETWISGGWTSSDSFEIYFDSQFFDLRGFKKDVALANCGDGGADVGRVIIKGEV